MRSCVVSSSCLICDLNIIPEYPIDVSESKALQLAKQLKMLALFLYGIAFHVFICFKNITQSLNVKNSNWDMAASSGSCNNGRKCNFQTMLNVTVMIEFCKNRRNIIMMFWSIIITNFAVFFIYTSAQTTAILIHIYVTCTTWSSTTYTENVVSQADHEHCWL